MFSTSEVYFYRQNTLNLTNTDLARRGKNNNPFQRDSYLQNINTILCIVIKYKQAFNIGMQQWFWLVKKAGAYFNLLTYVVINNNSNVIINVYVKLIIRLLWYVTFYCNHFSGTNREVSGLHFEGPSTPYYVHCGYAWLELKNTLEPLL